MFRWTEETIKYRNAAAGFNRMEERLAEELAEIIPRGARICDAGCGLGYLSLALARRGYRVSAVDTEPGVISILRENAVKEAAGINIMNEDVFRLSSSEIFDSMIFSFFGNTQQILQITEKHCTGQAIIIKKDWDTHRFTAEKQMLENNPFRQVCRELSDMRIDYQTRLCRLDTGQPFRSISDAEHFFELYEGHAGVNMLKLKKRLIETGIEAFPYYLPCERQIGIITLCADDIRI